MYLDKIKLQGFRSYQRKEFEFSKEGNLILGPNGSGKTNLMEAIAYTAIGKSVRYHQDQDLLKQGEEFFSLDALYQDEFDSPLKIQLSYSERKKYLKINQQSANRLSALFSFVKVIYCAPDDIQLINGSPSNRRQYFDMAISQLFPEYMDLLRAYLHIVEQRNKLLKNSFEEVEKTVWDRHFANALVQLYPYRLKYLKLLQDKFKELALGFGKDKAKVSLCYLPTIKGIEGINEEGIEKQLKQALAAELKWQRSTLGAHLDDYCLSLAQNPMRSYASQGQKRMAVVLLKLVQAALIEDITKVKPIILFDDVFAELDKEHSAKVYEHSKGKYQLFIAAPKSDVKELWGRLNTIELKEENTK